MKTLICLTSVVFLCQLASGQNSIFAQYRQCSEDLSITLQSLSVIFTAELEVKDDEIRQLDSRCDRLSLFERSRCQRDVWSIKSSILSDIRFLNIQLGQDKAQALRIFYDCKLNVSADREGSGQVTSAGEVENDVENEVKNEVAIEVENEVAVEVENEVAIEVETSSQVYVDDF